MKEAPMRRRALLLVASLAILPATVRADPPFLVYDIALAYYDPYGSAPASGELSLNYIPDSSRGTDQLIIAVSDETNGFHRSFPVVIDGVYDDGRRHALIGHTVG